MPVKVNKDICVGCGACADQCPVASIVLADDGKAQEHPETCIDCGACVDGCPAGAITQE